MRNRPDVMVEVRPARGNIQLAGICCGKFRIIILDLRLFALFCHQNL
jgi:hypothetical protein